MSADTLREAEDDSVEYCYSPFYEEDLTAGWKVESHRYRAAIKGLLSELETMTNDLYEFNKKEAAQTRLARSKHYERERRKGADI